MILAEGPPAGGADAPSLFLAEPTLHFISSFPLVSTVSVIRLLNVYRNYSRARRRTSLPVIVSSASISSYFPPVKCAKDIFVETNSMVVMSMKSAKREPMKVGGFQIEVGDVKPIFSNFAQINHKDDEFSFTFVHLFPIPGQPAKGTVKAVVTLTPQHAKRFINALKDNLRKYEQKFGEIKLLEEKKESRITYRA